MLATLLRFGFNWTSFQMRGRRESKDSGSELGWGEVGDQWQGVGSGMAWGDSVHLLTCPPTPKDD